MKVLFLVMVVCLLAGGALADELVVATTTYCPLSCDDETGQKGIMHDVLVASFEGSGYTLRFDNIPYGRAIQGTLDGKYVAVTFAGTANSPGFLFVRNLVMTNVVRFAVPDESSWRYAGVRSLEKVRIGIPTGFRTGNPELDSYLANPGGDNRIVLSSGANPTEAQLANLKRMLEGRLDAMLCGSLAINFIVKRLDAEGRLRLDPTPIARFDNHIAFSPRHPLGHELRQLVERRVEVMREDGTLDSLRRAYGLE